MFQSVPHSLRGQNPSATAPPGRSRAGSALLALAVGFVLAVSTATPSSAGVVSQPSTPVSTTANVTPYVLRNEDGSLATSGGNLTCAYVGTFEWTSDRTDYDPVDPGTNFAVLIKDGAGTVVASADVTYYPDIKRLNFTATAPVEAVIVKGGQDANVYDYRPAGVLTDTGLGAPPNASLSAADLSNVTFCANPSDPPESNWCSPGYWRQSQHLASWGATGISPTALYTSYFPASTLSKKATNLNPTLMQVLQSPQSYGGAAFNNVGDLLSEAHPDVYWMPGDERTEDSCPLS